MNTPVFAKHSLYLYDLYHNETQFYHHFTSARAGKLHLNSGSGSSRAKTAGAPAGLRPPALRCTALATREDTSGVRCSREWAY